MHAHGARALELGGGGNGEPLTSGCRAKSRPGSRSSCCRRLRGGALGGASASTGDERVGLITSETRLSICDEDAWSGMVEPWAHLAPSQSEAPGAQAQTCSKAPTAWKMSERPMARRDGSALGAATTPARRPQQSPIGHAPLEHGLAVHASCGGPDDGGEKSRGGVGYRFGA